MDLLGDNLNLAKGSKTDEIKLSNEEIVNLHKKIRKEVKGLKRLKISTTKILKRAFIIEDMIENKYAISFTSKFRNFHNFVEEIKHKLNLCLQIAVFPRFKIFLGIFMTIFSILIVFGEVFGMLDERFQVIINQLITGNNSTLYLIFFTMLFIYGIVGVHYSIINVRIEGFYGLYGDNQTDISSQLYSAMYFLKILIYKKIEIFQGCQVRYVLISYKFLI